jgi:hypothetical protein
MAVIDESKYIKLVEIGKIVGKQILRKAFEKKFPEYPIIKISDTYCFAYEGNREEIIKQISDVFIEHYFPQSIDDPYEKVDYCLNRYDAETHNKYPVLFDTYKDFVYEKITNSKSSEKNLMAMVGTCVNLFRYLLSCMDELALKNKEENFDVNSLTEIDIRKIITSKDIPITYVQYLGYYLTYLKENKQLDIDITIKVKQGIKMKKDNDFYSLEEWSNFVNLAVDIDKHMQKAMNNVTYAKCWLYLLLHLCLAWRKSDILSMPALDNLLDIEKYDLNWFEENVFDMKDANYIISNTKLAVEQYLTQKTNAYKHFNIPDSFKLPVSIAIIIVEQWRRRMKTESLFGKDCFSSTLILTNYLGELMNKFSSIKANRTLLSFVDNLAEEVKVSEYVKISTYMRSHKTNYYNMSDTTSVYLHSMYSDTELNEVTIQLYDRGMFGWLYDSLLQAAEDEKVSQKTQTNLIAQMKQGISADRLEQLSELLYQQSITKERVINEVMKLSHDEIKNVIKKLADGSLTSKQDGVLCIRENNCKYPVRTDCMNCEYSIPTVYTLLSVCTELNNIFQKKIPSCQYDRIRTIDKMLKLYSVVKEAENTFGEEYVNSYIDSLELKQNICNTYKLLSAKEENLLKEESG